MPAKHQANVLAFRQRFARVCLKKKLNAGKTQAHNFLFSLERLWQNAWICELPGLSSLVGGGGGVRV